MSVFKIEQKLLERKLTYPWSRQVCVRVSFKYFFVIKIEMAIICLFVWGITISLLIFHSHSFHNG